MAWSIWDAHVALFAVLAAHGGIEKNDAILLSPCQSCVLLLSTTTQEISPTKASLPEAGNETMITRIRSIFQVLAERYGLLTSADSKKSNASKARKNCLMHCRHWLLTPSTSCPCVQGGSHFCMSSQPWHALARHRGLVLQPANNAAFSRFRGIDSMRVEVHSSDKQAEKRLDSRARVILIIPTFP